MIHNVTDGVRITVGAAVVQPSTAWPPYPGSVSSTQRMPKPKACCVDVETNGIIFTLDGTDPTAANGTSLAAGYSKEFPTWTEVKNLKMIRSGASDASVQMTYGASASGGVVH